MSLSIFRSLFLALVYCLFNVCSKADNARLCTAEFGEDKGSLDPYRFQGYWYATHFFWSGLPWQRVTGVQSLYVYTPGTPNTWTVAVGVYRHDDQCIRRLFNISTPFSGSNILRDPVYYHNVIDTDYVNYAVLLFCYRVRESGTCNLSDIQTVILSRTPDGLENMDVWTVVKERVKVCADPSQLQAIIQNRRCVCSLDNFEVGTGPRCG